MGGIGGAGWGGCGMGFLGWCVCGRVWMGAWKGGMGGLVGLGQGGLVGGVGLQ